MARDADPPTSEVSKEDVTSAAQHVEETPATGAANTIEDGDDVEHTAQPTDEVNSDEDTAASHTDRPRSPVRVALVMGLAIIAALSGLVGWLGYRVHQSHEAQQQRQLFLQVGRQGALNLTTIDYTHVDADVARILDSATGTFYDDFQQRAQPFIQVVKQAQSKSTGNIAEAGLESVTGDEAQVLVNVQVNTSLAGVPDPQLRGWRMRINVKRVGDNVVKVSNVAFVP
jgi:Mce-associated membrane protein